MRRAALVLVLAASAGCSLAVERPTGLVVECATIKDPCPPPDVPRAIVETFAAHVPGFDPDHALTIRWYDVDTTWTFGEIIAIGYSEPETDRIVTTSDGVTVHELMHHHLYRYRGDADANHADPGGPWTSAADDVVREIIDDYRGVLR